MLQSISSAIAALAWSGLALAGTVETTSSINRGIGSIDDISKNDIKFRSREILRRQNAISAAKMDAFEQRLAVQAQRATSSICDRCFVSRNALKISGLHRIVNPMSDEMRIDDPAQAPLDCNYPGP